MSECLPQSKPARRRNYQRLVLVLVAVSFPMLVCCGNFLPAFLQHPFIDQWHRQSILDHDRVKLSQIAEAIKQYESKYDAIPPAYTVDHSGHKLHSWRTLILPYLGYQGLYDRIDLSKSWDSKENSAAYATEVATYVTSAKKATNLTGSMLFPNDLLTNCSHWD